MPSQIRTLFTSHIAGQLYFLLYLTHKQHDDGVDANLGQR